MSGLTLAKDVKLIKHRWAMHAVQALAHRDAELLTRVFSEIEGLPENAVNTKVEITGFGAPMQFYDYGFFDGTSSAYGDALFETGVVRGDTLLLIALRRHDPQSALALLKRNASLELANAANQSPMEILFDAYAAFQLHQKRSSDKTPAGIPFANLLPHESHYKELFAFIHDQLTTYHDDLLAQVEAQLVALYTLHAPDRLQKVGVQMNDFEFRERELLASVTRKYGDDDGDAALP